MLGNTSFLVEGNNPDRTLLVDCGALVPLALEQTGKLSKVTDVLITHAHADHCGGLEYLGFANYFVLRNRGKHRPTLRVASSQFARNLWEHSLSGGMGLAPYDSGDLFHANLETYFRVKTGLRHAIPGMPSFKLFPARHGGMDNHGVRFANGVYYSGDSIELPPHDASAIFQDCQFSPGGPAPVHTTYDRLLNELPPAVRAKTHLVHLGKGHENFAVVADGFAGKVMPGQTFEFP